MNADEFRDYILGFIFYKYLSEKIEAYADYLLEADGVKFGTLRESVKDEMNMIDAVQDATVEHLGYFLRPSEACYYVGRG
ncbi:type I restriction-modification system subunit M N-terminal domain-containing protein [Thiolinea disciformis]|uniref:type I restriction-modification system subunit M N-terminal domain-containing protein n=1 Tax=Thiolinea disciformis TaxID=125614 RepID=UPI00037B6E2B